MRVKELAAFIKAREEHRTAKTLGLLPHEWKQDPIIAQYRFCNVRREDDRVTKWIAANWRAPHADDPHLWFAMIVARLFNLPFTLNAIGYPAPWKAGTVARKLTLLRAHGNKIFNGAYIVSTNGRAMDKVQYLIMHVLDPLWAKRKAITQAMEDAPLVEVHRILMYEQGLGSFMAAQIVADLKYAPPYYDTDLDLPTSHAPDWYTFAAPGPGSKRGLNRVMYQPTDKTWPGRTWLATMEILHNKLIGSGLLPQYLGSYFHMQDLQNCLCEFDKYERARLGEGRPKQFYKPYKGAL